MTFRRAAIQEWLPLVFLLLLAAAVRLWGIDFGLPHTNCRPDETSAVDFAIRFGGGDLNPHYFAYPTLYPYVLLALYTIYYAIGAATGRYASSGDFIMEYVSNPTNFFLIDRFLSALFGTATVLVVFFLAKRMFGRQVALVSSFFLALAYLHVRDSHFGTVDIAMTFMIVTAVLFFIKSSEAKSWQSYLFAGLMTGLAASVKYNGFILIASMFIVHVWNVVEEKGRPMKLILDGRLWLFSTCVILAFLVGTPYALLDVNAFVQGMTGEVAHLYKGHGGVILGRGWWYHLKITLWIGMGWSLLLAAILGMGLAAKTSLKKALLLCSFPIIYYLIAGRGYTVFFRYVLPLVPFLCISAAVFADRVATWVGRQQRKFIQAVIGYGLAVLLILPSAGRIAKFNGLLAREDNRIIAARWVQQNVAAGATVFQTGANWNADLQLYRTLESLRSDLQTTGQGITQQARIRFMERGQVKGFNLWTFDEPSRTFQGYGKDWADLPDYIILAESPVALYSWMTPEIQDLVDSCYQLERTFTAGDFSDQRNVYDPLDGFFMPYDGFKHIARPGPNIKIYKRLSNREHFQFPESGLGARTSKKM